MNLQEEYTFLADSIKRLRERAAKLPAEPGGDAIPKTAAGMLVYHLRAAESEAKSIAEVLAKDATRAAHE